MNHLEDSHGPITSAEPAKLTHREALRQSVLRAYSGILENLDYDKVSALTGRDVETLRKEADEMLRSLLHDYPNCTASMGHGWHLSLIERSFGIRSVEVSFPVTWHSELVVDFAESAKAAELGLLDEDGEHTHPAPACWHCKRPFTPSEQ